MQPKYPDKRRNRERTGKRRRIVNASVARTRSRQRQAGPRLPSGCSGLTVARPYPILAFTIRFDFGISMAGPRPGRHKISPRTGHTPGVTTFCSRFAARPAANPTRARHIDQAAGYQPQGWRFRNIGQTGVDAVGLNHVPLGLLQGAAGKQRVVGQRHFAAAAVVGQRPPDRAVERIVDQRGDLVIAQSGRVTGERNQV